MARSGGWVLLVVAALCLGGCKKKASPAECEAMADRLVEFLKANPAMKADADYAPMRTTLVNACQKNGTTSEVARCVAASASAQESAACQLNARR
jgi:hypothetical protein